MLRTLKALLNLTKDEGEVTDVEETGPEVNDVHMGDIDEELVRDVNLDDLVLDEEADMKIVEQAAGGSND